MSKERTVWKWTNEEDNYINGLLIEGNTIVLSEVSEALMFSVNTIRKKLNDRSKEISLKLPGLWMRDIVVVETVSKESVTTKPKKQKPSKPTYKYVCKCSTDAGIVTMVARAQNEEKAKESIENSSNVKVLSISLEEDHRRDNHRSLTVRRQYI